MNIPKFDRELIFAIFLCAGVGLSLKFTEPIRGYSLITIKGELKDVPYWSSTGGDFTYEYVRINLTDGRHFDLQNCVYQAADLAKINQLTIGDSIVFQAEDTLASEDEYKVYSVISSRNGNILGLEDFNRCNLSRWRVISYTGIFMCVVLCIRYIVRFLKGD